MTYEIYRYIFIGGAILAGVMLVVSVLVFFLLRIPTVIGDLTGSNARKAIENIRSQNESTGNKTYQSSTVNKERGKITDKISRSGRLSAQASLSMTGAMSTEQLKKNNQVAQGPASETTVLSPEPASETTVLSPEPAAETTVLSQDFAAETTVLNSVDIPVNNTPVVEASAYNGFVIEYEITYIHTNEMIPQG